MINKRLALIMCVVCVTGTMLTGCAAEKQTENTPKQTKTVIFESEPPPAATQGIERTPAATPTTEPPKPVEQELDSPEDISPIMQAAIEKFREKLSDLQKIASSVVEISITAKGNTVVFSFKYLVEPETLGANVDTMPAGLEQYFMSKKEETKEMLNDLEKQGIDSPSLVFEVIGKNGELIHSKEIK